MIDPRTLPAPQQRSLQLEQRFRIDHRNIDQLCAKYEMKRHAFQMMRKARGAQFAAEEELVISGIGRGATVEQLIPYLDWRNHAVYRPEEIREFLGNLESIGILVENAGVWSFAPSSPAAEGRFVFTAPKGAAHQPVYFGEQRHPHWSSGA